MVRSPFSTRLLVPMRLPALTVCLAAGLLAGCALQPPAQTSLPAAPAHWTHAGDPSPTVSTPAGNGLSSRNEAWWEVLHDPAIDTLVTQADRSAPTLGIALARIEQARATLDAAQATRRPQLGASLSASRGTNTATFPISIENVLSASLNASWEVDLFGRLRHSAAAAQNRLDARLADAQLAKLSLDSQVADTVLLLRACALTTARQADTVLSSETTLRLTEIKRGAGLAAPLDVARSRTSVGEARSSRISTESQCRQYSETLADLVGSDSSSVMDVLSRSGPPDRTPLPTAPDIALELPATVLAAHPSLVSAQRAADAAFEDIGQARAGRLPSLNLAALLSSSRIQFGAFNQNVNGWSLNPSLSGTPYDGGSGAANVAGARGRHAEALANLQQTLRDTVRDVEIALIQGDSAGQGEHEAALTVQAADDLFRASEAAQKAGRLNVFDLETARSALLSAQTSLISAQRDRARAWVALVKASGNTLAVPPSPDLKGPRPGVAP